MLRKYPGKRGGLFDWTLLFFPNLAVKSIFRKLFPSRAVTDREKLRYNEAMTDRFSLGYFFAAWTLAGFIIYKVLGSNDPDRGGDFPGLEGARYHAAKRAENMPAGKQMKLLTITGTSINSENITDEINQAIEEKGGYSITSAERYDDPEYIRKRLGNPEIGSYNPIIAKHYVKRLDSQRV